MWKSLLLQVQPCEAPPLWGLAAPEIVATIQTMQREHFYKSMTAYADLRLWQDVYHVPSPVGVLYVKFTADVITEFLLLSFKGKDND